MKKINIIFLGIFVINAYASVNDGVYLGINGGLTNNIVILNASTYSTVQTGGSQLYNANVGYNIGLDVGYNFDAYNGMELGYNYSSPTLISIPGSITSLTTSATALSLSYKLYLPTFIENWSVFGRVGVAYNSVNQGIFNSSGSCNCTNTLQMNAQGTTFADVLGAGLRYKMTPNSTLNFEWIANGLIFPIGLNQGTSNIASWYSQNFNIGLNYHF
ncbi:MAG: outer membrane beta-barrel protein [Burkholderiales bacterium]|nr:outer membrane beta-barrel protein [Burkholderiales bacterium]